MKIKLALFAILINLLGLQAQENKQVSENYISKVWVSDLDNGMYKNPMLHVDYSDPDGIKVGVGCCLV